VNPAAIAAPPSPYKGLAPFEDSALDALLFFGRERQIEVIVANLMASRLTVLYGVSGVGKTSLLRAGVAHRLRRAHDALVVVLSSWTGDPVADLLDAVRAAAPEGVEPVRQGGSFADELSAWTRRLESDVYVILDQFEEYFLYHENERGAGTLMDELPEALRRRGLRVNFLLGVREDALAQLDAFKVRIPNLFGNSLRLDRLDLIAARAAIEGPLERYNELVPNDQTVSAEPDLVETVLHQVAVGRVDLGQSGRGGVGEEDANRIEAPYLQLVLERLWEVETASGSRRLRLDTLERLGGAAHIVEDHLERAMAELSPEEKDAAAAMYNYLVTPSGTKIAHRAGDLAGYASVDEAETERVLKRLVEERIVRAAEDGAAGPRYEIFHDVLAEAVLAWRARHEADRELERERRTAAQRHRRLLVFAITAAVLLALLSALAVYALVQRGDARTQARHSRARELAALAEAELPVDPVGSVRLALSAARLEQSSIVEDVLRKTLAALRVEHVLPTNGAVSTVAVDRSKHLLVTAGEGGARVYDVANGKLFRTLVPGAVAAASFSPDDRVIVTVGPTGARLWDAATGKEVRVLDRRATTAATFAPRGGVLATTREDGSVRLWSIPSGRLQGRLRQPGSITGVSFSGDGRRLVTAGDRVARVFDARTGRLVGRFAQPTTVTVARLSPDGRLLATGAPDYRVRIWNTATGRRRTLIGHKGSILDVEFSPDGRRLVSASTDESARVWDTHTGQFVTILRGNENFVVKAIYSPNGQWIATASTDRAARIFDADSGDLRGSFVGHGNSVTDVAFSSDGRTLVTGSTDGTARIWDARTRREPDFLAHDTRQIGSLAFTADDRTVVVAGGSGAPGGLVRGVGLSAAQADFTRMLPAGSTLTAIALSDDGSKAATVDLAGRGRIWNLKPGSPGALPRGDLRPVRALAGHGVGIALAFSSDGELLAAVDGQRTLRVWRVKDGSLMRTTDVPDGTVETVSFSPDDRHLVTTGGKTARIWNIDSGKLEHVLAGHTKALTSAAFSPDGSLIVTTSFDHDARIWDARTGKPRSLLRDKVDYAVVNDGAFSADGRWVVTAGPQGAAIWSAQTGRFLFFVRSPRELLLSTARFSHHGWRIATGGATNGSIEAYDCRLCGTLDDLVAMAENRLANIGRKG